MNWNKIPLYKRLLNSNIQQHLDITNDTYGLPDYSEKSISKIKKETKHELIFIYVFIFVCFSIWVVLS